VEIDAIRTLSFNVKCSVVVMVAIDGGGGMYSTSEKVSVVEGSLILLKEYLVARGLRE
jgi:hypothetical protein